MSQRSSDEAYTHHIACRVCQVCEHRRCALAGVCMEYTLHEGGNYRISITKRYVRARASTTDAGQARETWLEFGPI